MQTTLTDMDSCYSYYGIVDTSCGHVIWSCAHVMWSHRYNGQLGCIEFLDVLNFM